MRKEPMYRMPVSLRSTHSKVEGMAAGLYVAVVEHGLRLPAQQTVAEGCGYSAATLSRRLQGRSLDDLVVRLCDARDRTFPWTRRPDWPDWLPEGREDRADARAWFACQHLALTSPRVADAVRRTWERQRAALSDMCDDADAVHALVEGLTARMIVDEEFSHERATSILSRAARV